MELEELWEILIADIVKLKSLAVLPILCVGYAARAESNELHAWSAIAGSLSKPRPTDEEIAAEIAKFDGPADDPRWFEGAKEFWEGLLQDDIPALASGRDAQLSAIVLWAYTLFESLSGDLWKVAVNNRPYSLAKNVVYADGTGKTPPPIRLSFDSLVECRFDVRAKMGDLLVKEKKVSFESIKGIEDSYHAAFPNPSSEKRRPNDELKRLFAEYGPTLKKLECVRNLIAHRGGRIDYRYREALEERNLPACPLGDGEQYPLQPSEIAELGTASVNLAKALFAFVDDWLHKHPD